MESEVPYAVGLIDLDGVSTRLFSRIVGRGWEQMKIGDPVRFEPFDLPDGRVFYRFRAVGSRDPALSRASNSRESRTHQNSEWTRVGVAHAILRFGGLRPISATPSPHRIGAVVSSPRIQVV